VIKVGWTYLVRPLTEKNRQQRRAAAELGLFWNLTATAFGPRIGIRRHAALLGFRSLGRFRPCPLYPFALDPFPCRRCRSRSNISYCCKPTYSLRYASSHGRRPRRTGAGAGRPRTTTTGKWAERHAGSESEDDVEASSCVLRVDELSFGSRTFAAGRRRKGQLRVLSFVRTRHSFVLRSTLFPYFRGAELPFDRSSNAPE
jgi:hypothetical protein